MTAVYAEIFAHPYYTTLSDRTRFGIAVAYDGFSWRTKKNNKSTRNVWRHLYLGIPLKD